MSTYTDVSPIGSGGFGEVWRCESVLDGTNYAKKILQDGMDNDGIKRFQREVRILDSLNHPNVVNVIAKQLHTEPYYYIMPLYENSLWSVLEEIVGQEKRIHQIYLGILNAVEYAHQQGVIHRDLKPDNVLINNDVELVVTDFGLGRILTSASTRLTQSGHRMGTPFYMAPEQLRDAKCADERADVFSLGRMLYELYTGPLTSSIQDQSLLPPGVAMVVNRCTYSDPTRRFQSVTELKRAWVGLFDENLHDNDLDELVKLQTDLAFPENASLEKCIRFLELIALYQDNSDLLHEIIMKMDSSIFSQIVDINPELTRDIIERFVDFTSHQGWGFSYTDQIGAQCRNLFFAISDFEIRSLLTLCALYVGINHNRWYVIGVFGELLANNKEPGEYIPLIEKLRDVDERIRIQAAVDLTLQNIHPEIRTLFEFE